jgi:hypothetical protein
MSFRKITSLTVLWAFLFLVLTGIVLYIVPQGRVAYWADWTLLGLDKVQWGHLHVTMGLLMLLGGLVHIYFNWRPIVSYLKDGSRRLRVLTPEFNVALVVALLFGGLAWAELPPIAWVLDLSDSVKQGAARRYGEPPYGHAESSSLETFIQRVGLDPKRSRDALRAAGIRWEDSSEPIASIAGRNGLTPQEVYQAMAAAAPGEDTAGLPAEPPRGMGRRAIGEICESHGVETAEVLALLARLGHEASAEDTFRSVAEASGVSAHDLYSAVRERLGEPGE